MLLSAIIICVRLVTESHFSVDYNVRYGSVTTACMGRALSLTLGNRFLLKTGSWMLTFRYRRYSRHTLAMPI